MKNTIHIQGVQKNPKINLRSDSTLPFYTKNKYLHYILRIPIGRNYSYSYFLLVGAINLFQA